MEILAHIFEKRCGICHLKFLSADKQLSREILARLPSARMRKSHPMSRITKERQTNRAPINRGGFSLLRRSGEELVRMLLVRIGSVRSGVAVDPSLFLAD